MQKRLNVPTQNKLQRPLVLIQRPYVVIFPILVNLVVVVLAMMSKKLMTFFADLLNDNSITNVMLVGIGNMGHALLHYRFHERNKMKIIMAFDLDDHPEIGTPNS